MTPAQATEAAFLRLALTMNLVPEATVAAWLDDAIIQSPSPEPALVDAALAGNSRSALHEALRPLTNGADFAQVNKRLAQLLLPKAEQSVQAAQALSRDLYEAQRRGTLVLTEAQQQALTQADSMFDLAQIQAWGTFGEAKEALIAFLRNLAG